MKCIVPTIFALGATLVMAEAAPRTKPLELKEVLRVAATIDQLLEKDLKARKLDWVVLRPSLVMAANSYGGTATLWHLARFPLCLPVVGRGDQVFQPVMIDDLCRVVLNALTRPQMKRVTLDVVGPEVLEVRDIVKKLRAWFGKKPAPLLSVPLWLARTNAGLADALGVGPMRTTALQHLLYGNIGGRDALPRMKKLAGCAPETLDAFLARTRPEIRGR